MLTDSTIRIWGTDQERFGDQSRSSVVRALYSLISMGRFVDDHCHLLTHLKLELRSDNSPGPLLAPGYEKFPCIVTEDPRVRIHAIYVAIRDVDATPGANSRHISPGTFEICCGRHHDLAVTKAGTTNKHPRQGGPEEVASEELAVLV